MQIRFLYRVGRNNLYTRFCTPNFNGPPFLSPLNLEAVMYLFGKPQDLLFESTYKIRRMCTLREKNFNLQSLFLPNCKDYLAPPCITFWEYFIPSKFISISFDSID